MDENLIRRDYWYCKTHNYPYLFGYVQHPKYCFPNLPIYYFEGEMCLSDANSPFGPHYKLEFINYEDECELVYIGTRVYDNDNKIVDGHDNEHFETFLKQRGHGLEYLDKAKKHPPGVILHWGVKFDKHVSRR